MSNNVNSNNDSKNKKKIIVSVIAVILVIIILLLLRSCSADNDNPKNDFNISSEEESWNGEQNKPNQVETGLMEIPYYGTLFVSEEEPYVWFNNPSTNDDVYFSYEVYEGEEEVFHNEEYISPGKAIKADLYNYFKEGRHEITINISAVDGNGAGCNGATQEAVVVVQ